MKSIPTGTTLSFSLLLSLLLAGCLCGKKTSDMRVTKGQEFTLQLGKTAMLEGSDLEVTFVEVQEDSRCPLYTNCIWEGQVRIKIEVKRAGNPTALEFTRKGQETVPLTQVIDELKYTVWSVIPYPEAGKTIELADYSLKMLID